MTDSSYSGPSLIPTTICGDFLALDVETANSDLSSICQIGIASFSNGRLVNTWASLVNPDDYFDPINISIHGIDEQTVRNAPTWFDLFPKVRGALEGRVVVSHTAFDRVSLLRACDRYQLQEMDCCWLDSAKVVRRTWAIFARSGYGLSNVAAHLSRQYRAHDALEDARCAGEIVLRAIAETGLGVHEWLSRASRPIHPIPNVVAGNPEGPLYGEVLVFTGALSLVRHDAVELAAAAGCEVDAGVTKRTTLLVIGDQDARKLAGHEKSSKHRKAEVLIAGGQRIRIITEQDFNRILEVGQHCWAAGNRI